MYNRVKRRKRQAGVLYIFPLLRFIFVLLFLFLSFFLIFLSSFFCFFFSFFSYCLRFFSSYLFFRFSSAIPVSVPVSVLVSITSFLLAFLRQPCHHSSRTMPTPDPRPPHARIPTRSVHLHVNKTTRNNK